MARPKPIRIDSQHTLRVVRGPHVDNPNSWYWKLVRYNGGVESTVEGGSSWGTASQAIVYVETLLSGIEEEVQGPTTVAGLLTKWLEAKQLDTTIVDSSKAMYASKVKRLTLAFGRTLINDEIAWNNWKRACLLTYGEISFNGFILVLKTAWKYGITQGWLPKGSDTPIGRIKKPRAVAKKFTPSEAETELLFNNLECQPWISLVLNVCRYTGARIGEAVSLSWEDIDLDMCTVLLNGKTGPRTVPINSKLIELLTAWKQLGQANRYGNIFNRHPSTASKAVNTALQEAAVRSGITGHMTVHSLRRYVANRLKRKGIDLKTAADWLGHDPATLVKFYSATTDEDLERAMAALE